MALEDLLGLPERVEEFLEDVPACCLAFNRWGTVLAAGCTDGMVGLYDYQTRGLAASLAQGHPPTSSVTALLWTSDGRTLLSGASDGSLAAWDVASCCLRQALLPGGAAAISHLAWAGGRHDGEPPGGRGQGEDEVLVSMAAGPAQLLRLSGGSRAHLPMMCLGPDGRPLGAPEAEASGQVAVPSLDGALLYAGTRGTVMVLRRSDLALLDVIKLGGSCQVTALQLNGSGRRLLVLAADHRARIFLLHRPGHRQPLRAQQRLARAAADRSSGGLDPGNGPAGAQAQQQDAQPPEAWDARTLDQAAAAAGGEAGRRRGGCGSVLHEDGAAWATLHHEIAADSNRRQWKCAAFSPCGEYLATALAGDRHEAQLWEVEQEGRSQEVLELGTRDGVEALCWHPTCTPLQLLTVGGGRIYIWAKAFTENWSAFAPDFTELEANQEYVEPEDEFDMNPRPQDEQQEAGGGDDEREPVDIGTPEERRHALAELLHASPDSQLPLLHLPLQLKHLPKAGRPSNASELSPAAKAGGTPAAQ